MADFDLEQLRTVLDGMVAKLDATAGDKGTHDELNQIKDALRRIQQHVSNGAKANPREQKAFIQNFFTEWDRQNPLKDLRQAVDDLNDTVEKNPLRDGGSKGGGTGSGAGGAGGFFGKMTESGGNMAKASKYMAMTAAVAFGAIKEGYGYAKEQASAYRALTATAEGSITSIIQMKDLAAQNNMSTQDLVQTMQSERNLRVLGAKDWAKWSNSVRTATLYTGGLAMDFADLTEAQDTYMQSLRNAGFVKGEGIKSMTQHLIDLVGINQTIASMMGKTRKEQEQAAKDQSLDANFQAAMKAMGLRPEEIAKANTFASSLTDSEQRIFKETLASGGNGPVTDAAAKDYVMGGRLTEQIAAEARRFYSNKALDPETARENIRSAGVEEDNRDRGLTFMRGFLGTVGDESASSVNSMLLLERSLKARADANGAKDAVTGKDLNNGEKAILSIEEQEHRLSAALDDIVNQGFKAAINSFGDQLLNWSKKIGQAVDGMHAHAAYLQDHPDQAMTEGAGIGFLPKLLGGLAAWEGGKFLFRGLRGGARAGGMAAEAGGLVTRGGLLRTGGRLLGKVAAPVTAGFAAYDGYKGWNDLAESKRAYGDTSNASRFRTGLATAFSGVTLGLISREQMERFDKWNFGFGDGSTAGPGEPRASSPKGVQLPASVANATGQQHGQAAGVVQGWDRQMLEMQHAIHFTLNDIKKASYDQLDTMREELAHHRTAQAQITRLLEESNKNTKQIQSLN